MSQPLHHAIDQLAWQLPRRFQPAMPSFACTAALAAAGVLVAAGAAVAAPGVAPPAAVAPAAASAPAMRAAVPPAAAPRSVLPPAARPPSTGAAQPAAAPAIAAQPQPAAPATARAAPAGRWVALDAGHRPGEGSRAASGLAEHNFNLRFVAALEAQLQARHIAVRRLPSHLSLADRAQRAQGAALAVSVHHDGAAAVKAAGASAGSGNALTIGQAGALACAQQVGLQLQAAGRHFATGPGVAWADKRVGVRRHGEGALLQQAAVQVVKLSVADIGNPAEERLAGQPRWVDRQAAAVARGIAQCLGLAGTPPGAAQSAAVAQPGTAARPRSGAAQGA